MSDHGFAKMPYRRDIDGLRAIAVLAVVLYHFGVPLRGGFVGVDIFFVISGFLIGGLLWREIDATGRISLRDFYVRRFRRLAPAFFAMVGVTALIGWMILLPFEYRELGKSAIAATVYLSNVFFYRQAGYFDTTSEEKPLLHTWSLAVEEQFYVFLPLLLIAVMRWYWGSIAALVFAWAASLAACIVLTPSLPTATFYLFPFRAWELLSGVLLAIYGHETRRRWQGAAWMSWLGFALIVLSITLIPAGPLFPGILAIPPVLGTVLVLSSGAGDNSVNRLLTHRSMVLIGLLSYSLYLWHWPIYTLSDYLRGGHANLIESAGWMLVSLGVAWLSWRFVETPIRRANRLGPLAILSGTALASALVLGGGAWVYLKQGLPQRFSKDAQIHIAASADFLQDWSRCYIASDLPLDGLEICPIGPEGPPKVLVWGDSHARAFKEGLDLAAHEAGTPGIILWRAGCAPLIGIRKVESAATPEQDTACTQATKQIEQSFGRLPSLETVLLIGRWAYYGSGKGFGLDQHNEITLHSTTGPLRTDLSQPDLLARAAQDTVAHLSRWVTNIHVLRQPPELPMYHSRLAAREAAHAGNPLAPPARMQDKAPIADLTARAAVADAPWAALGATGQITQIDTWAGLCDARHCHAIAQGVGQYFDNNHLTNSAAIRLRDIFLPVFSTDHTATIIGDGS